MLLFNCLYYDRRQIKTVNTSIVRFFMNYIIKMGLFFQHHILKIVFQGWMYENIHARLYDYLNVYVYKNSILGGGHGTLCFHGEIDQF